MRNMSWKNVPHFAADFVFSNFAAAIATREDGCTGIYTADLKRDWCIGFGGPPSSSCSSPQEGHL